VTADDAALRRVDDTRIGSLSSKVERLDTKVERLDVKVNEIRDWLITEPEASAMGRALLRRADMNAADIRDLKTQQNQHDDWIQQFKGSARIILYVPTVLSAAAAVIAMAAAVGWHPGR
jgi:outer membrane murein-binding lipoprotein Lpp